MGTSEMSGTKLWQEAIAFKDILLRTKEQVSFQDWYPYDTLSNFFHLEDTFNQFPLSEIVAPGKRILDIGAADGELAFFLERLGYQTSIIDHAPTNHNNLNGVKALAKAFDSKVQIIDFDIDSYSPINDVLPKDISITFLLGIHYHLKNPFLILDELAKRTKYLVFSTRIARYSPRRYEMKRESLSYLLEERELNNDPTNYWVFSQTALETLFNRTGFKVLKHEAIGDVKKSVPNDMNHDERYFALLVSEKYEGGK